MVYMRHATEQWGRVPLRELETESALHQQLDHDSSAHHAASKDVEELSLEPQKYFGGAQQESEAVG
jgi:hypothetical protein